MSVPGKRDNVLILGGGDGLAVRELLKYDDIKLIHLVDIDPEMTRISATLPMLTKLNENSLDSEKLTIFNQDAFSFVNRAGIDYDRVIIDMPDPHNEAINKLYSKEFYTMIKKRMSTDGLVITQSSSPFFTLNTFWCIERTLDHIFDGTLSFHTAIPSFGVWGYHMARVNGSVPTDFSFDVETRFMNADVMKAAMVFSDDIAKVDVPVNSIMEPKLYQLYLKDLTI